MGKDGISIFYQVSGIRDADSAIPATHAIYCQKGCPTQPLKSIFKASRYHLKFFEKIWKMDPGLPTHLPNTNVENMTFLLTHNHKIDGL